MREERGEEGKKGSQEEKGVTWKKRGREGDGGERGERKSRKVVGKDATDKPFHRVCVCKNQQSIFNKDQQNRSRASLTPHPFQTHCLSRGAHPAADSLMPLHITT